MVCSNRLNKKQFKDEIDNGYITFGTHNGKEYVAFKYNLNNATDASFDMDLEMGSYTANLALFTTLLAVRLLHPINLSL